MDSDRFESVDHTILSIANALRGLADRLEMTVGERQQPSRSRPMNGSTSPLTIDRATFSVRWDSRECVLGATISFRLFERLARRPNHYASHAQLLEDVWGGTRSVSTIRSAVGELRKSLAVAGMGDLAQMIDGQHRGHYGLMLR